MTKVVVFEQVPQFFLEEMKAMGYETIYAPEEDRDKVNETLKYSQGVVIRSHTQVNEEFLSNAPDLKFILRPGSGLENVDVEAVENRGILLLNSPEGNKNAVAEHAIGMLLSLLHNIPKSFQEIREGKWLREANCGNELLGSTVAIIGFGNTGSAFAEKLKGFGVKILVFDKYKDRLEGKGENIKEAGWDTIKREADIISFHVPYNKETHHLFNEELLHGFKKPIYLINTSRGGIVKTEALLRGIKKEKVKGACLDVLENENLKSYTDEEKRILDELIATNRVLITPHVAGWSYTSMEDIFRYLLKKLSKKEGLIS